MRLGGVLAVLILGSASAARAQDLADAHVFVSALYAAYQRHEPAHLGRQARAVFSPRILALIRLDTARTPAGDIGALDGDPICDCQDAGGLRVEDVQISGGGDARANATVRLRFPDGPRTMRLDLVGLNSHWRVDDVHTESIPSLVKYLEQHAGGR
ncbi:DUF3828 domain-containing protein [Phenylobacterium sp.]|uniref:DUF3828 domain-containing protein n=1 Tax=Phenylobacterium sp. TaxID=1871053 RepID=UPI002F3F2E85